MIICCAKDLYLFVLISIISVETVAHAQENSYEDAVDLSASDVLPESLTKGEHHTVDEPVQSDGYLNYYTVSSDYGEFEAVSTAMLRTRIGEINALAELDELSRTEVFLTAAADAGMGQIKALGQFVQNPVETVVGIPSGIGRMFKRYTRQAGEAIDATAEFVAGDDDEEDGADGEGDEASTTDMAVDLTESFMGVSGAQRALSQKLGTDPYSSNEVLQAAIKEVAWAERLGSFGMGFAGIPSIPGADIIGEVNDIVWSKDPYELQDLNRGRLEATGADPELIESYLEESRLTPSQQTLLTAAITEIANAGGRDGILRQALNVETEAEAGFLIKSVTMLAWYHINRKLVTSVLSYAAVPAGVSGDGSTAFLFAVDHVYWTDAIAEAAANHAGQMSGEGSGAVWLLGTASERTKSELDGLGLALYENVAAMMTAPGS